MSVMSLTNNGVRDWFWQRLSALVITLYTVFLSVYLGLHIPLTFLKWHDLFTHPAMRIFTLIVLVNILIHAWVGIWTIFTDYIGCAVLRLCLEFILIVSLLGYFFWGLEILWSL